MTNEEIAAALAGVFMTLERKKLTHGFPGDDARHGYEIGINDAKYQVQAMLRDSFGLKAANLFAKLLEEE